VRCSWFAMFKLVVHRKTWRLRRECASGRATRQRVMEEDVPPAGAGEPRGVRDGAMGAAMFVMRRLCDVRAALCCPARCCLLVLRGLLEELSPRTAVRGLERDGTVDTARGPAPGGIANQDDVTNPIGEQRP
jgi:hypothetical protein